MHIVRYADDFKIFCRKAKDAQRAFIAIRKWLKERIKEIKNKPDRNSCNKFNATILGMHNYYKIASNVNVDFSKIAFLVKKNLYNGTRNIRSAGGISSKTYDKLYGKYKIKTIHIADTILFPIAGVRTRPSRPFSPEICQYTELGREKIHKKLNCDFKEMVRYLLLNPVIGESLEYNDNRISLYIGQQGNCFISKLPLKVAEMEVHHKFPRRQGGKDKYSNLVFVAKDVHILIHSTRKGTVELYKEKLNLDVDGLNKINELRKFVGNCII